MSKTRNIGFVSTRFSGTDGVSLETAKWAEILDEMGYVCFYFAGELDRPEKQSMLCPKAHFTHPDISAINELVFGDMTRSEEITHQIEEIKQELKRNIREFIKTFQLDLIIVENAFAIPINIPLGIALTELVAETGIPTIAHNHDFYWERKRFSVNCVWDYLNKAFPPRHPFIRHVVINSEARRQLAMRRGSASIVVPNVMDYAEPPGPPDDYASGVRDAFGVHEHEYLILQPTRVIQRKGIEHAIELVRRLGMNGVKAKLVITHASGDEGGDYEQRVRQYSELMKVHTVFVCDLISEKRGTLQDGRKVYTLFDVYPHADLVTYPSTYEGFGNAFLEAIYFRRPILVNTYSIYFHDIKPKGFDVIEIDEFVTRETVEQVTEVLTNQSRVKEMVERNYRLAKQFYSYENLKRKLRFLLTDFFGEE